MALSPASSVAFHSSAMPLGKRCKLIGHTGDSLVIVRVLEPVVENKFANHLGKFAAWLSANHVEKPPKKKPPSH